MAPQAHQAPLRWIDALFTSTSAVCVTGLTVVDTATAFTRTGQWLIMLQIQIGGLGVMTVAALVFQGLRARLSFHSHAAIQETFFHEDSRLQLRHAVRKIIALTLLVELAGMLAIYVAVRSLGMGGWFEAAFMAVSAFCNAGFSVFSDNAISLSRSPLAMFTIMALVTVGGIGYTVQIETIERTLRRWRGQRGAPVRWSLHSRLVIRVSALLTFGGATAVALTGMTPECDTAWEIGLQSLFHSVSARTAGFNAVDLGLVPMPTVLILIALMFIGGSPGSCAGGIKTTSLIVWCARLWSRIRGRSDVVLGEREIPGDVVRRAAVVIALAGVWNLTGVFLLVLTESGSNMRLEQLIFEQVSAFGTVGLTTGITPHLSDLGKLWLCLSMFIGRLGPLTIAVAVVGRESRARFRYVEERVMIG
jgi:trk system potassium uptake protein TrkH